MPMTRDEVKKDARIVLNAAKALNKRTNYSWYESLPEEEEAQKYLQRELDDDSTSTTMLILSVEKLLRFPCYASLRESAHKERPSLAIDNNILHWLIIDGDIHQLTHGLYSSPHSIVRPNNEGKLPLHLAAELGNEAAYREILRVVTNPADKQRLLSMKDKAGNTAEYYLSVARANSIPNNPRDFIAGTQMK